MEQKCCQNRSWFITLTYADERVPRTATAPDEGRATLRKKDLDLFLKRTRKNNVPFRYFACGEYGDLTDRPHYHLAIFPTDLQHHSRYTEKWEAGFVTISELQPTRAKYVARYTLKKLNKTMESVLDGREAEFASMSRFPGLGHTMAHRIARTYQTKEGAGRLAERGDVEHTIRMDGEIWPIGDYVLGKIRYQLGIPATREERITINPNVDHYFPLELEEEHKYMTHEQSQEHHKRGEKTKIYRSETVNI